MIVTHKAEIDLINRNAAQWINTVQGDVNTRVLELSLYSNGAAWEPPDSVTIAMRYQKPDGTKGYYDTLPDGTQAWSVTGNVVTITMAPQMLTVAGMVLAQIEMALDINILATFTLQVNVEANPAAGAVGSEDYINWLAWMKTELNAALTEAKESGAFDGAAGPQGPAGPEGPRGANGAPGKTAYAYAVDGGYTGTEADFAKKLATEHLPLTGGIMTGPINMNGQPLSGLNAPTANDQAANKGYVDGAVKKAAPRSLMANSDFRNPVNQRSYVNGTTVSDYFIDQWQASSGAFNLSSDGIEITAGHMNQRIPLTLFEDGKTYTLACKVDGDILCYSGVKGTTIGSWDSGLAATFEPDYGICIVYLTKVGSKNEWVALYEGEYTAETLPEYQPKGYGVELTECLRYFHLYATEAARPTRGLDCSPPMRIDAVTQGTLEINGVTYYYNSADL